MEISIARYLQDMYTVCCDNPNFKDCVHNFVAERFPCTCKHGCKSALFIFRDGSKLFADNAYKANYPKLEAY